jgi:hypothetical protein
MYVGFLNARRGRSKKYTLKSHFHFIWEWVDLNTVEKTLDGRSLTLEFRL